MQKKLLSFSLLAILLFQGGLQHVTALDEAKTSSSPETREKATAPAKSDLRVNLSTATGKTIVFENREQPAEIKADSPDNEIPHLVLNRNGVPTPGFERTLHVSVDNLIVPSSGMYVQLVIETQHGDPDLDRRKNVRIRVRKEVHFVPYNALTQQGVSVRFNVTFDPLTELPHKTINTPTDYYRYRIAVSDAQGNQIQTYVDDYTFLMENQWRVPLPKVSETTPGAAPAELLVYYYDMIPFQTNLRDPDTRIPREEVDGYIQTELIPAMVEAFQVQTDVWGFPWHAEWRNFRREEDPKTLSVALGEHQIWFHGKPPSLGHSMISIRVDGTTGEYDNLTDGIMSVFHHELFHNHQRNISLHYNEQASVAGKDQAWMMFSEGTAVMASSVGQPAVQFAATAQWRSYLKRANAFLGTEGAVGGGLNKSYRDIPYHTAIYWRFLYENCGGINENGEDPATGMRVIREILETLYKGEIVQINSSTDVASALPRILDHALQAAPSCRFHSYEESLTHFARAIYMLRLEEGRCRDLNALGNCGFVDLHNVYQTPPADSHVVAGAERTTIEGAIPSSYGIDLIELSLDPAAAGKTLKLVFTSAGESDAAFHVEVWQVRSMDENGETTDQPAQLAGPMSITTESGSLTLELRNLNGDDFDRLGLVITRMDPYEEKEATGEYSIQLMSE